MQLKRIEMYGFKSFADRTRIDFEPGVTGVVGPNGCGKSNVVDAVKWVLGTQSYKSVRGAEMLDVIFKGAEGVAPMGMAEVSLTFHNGDRALPLDFEEVTITRRVHQDGVGDYRINDAPCRLKDIRELFYGTGIGTNNYAIIEQGKLDRLILSNPKERRLVFEEAAGISKYRAKRREAETRLEKVTQDLLRLQDILREVQKSLRSVRAQAGRAQRYKELTAALEGRRRRLTLHEHYLLLQEAREVAARREEREQDYEKTAGERERARAELEARQARLAELDERLAGAQSRIQGLESKAGYVDQSIRASRSREAELEEERHRREEERRDLETKRAELEEESRRQEEERSGVEEAWERLRVEVAEGETAVADADRECARVGEQLERVRSEVVEAAHKESQYKSEGAQIAAEVRALGARRERVSARASAAREEQARLQAESESTDLARGALRGEIARLMTRKEEGDAALAGLRAEVVDLEKGLQGLRQDRERRASRQDTLRDIELQMEGLDSGAKELLRAGFPGILGAVADFLEVEAPYLTAVEAALGERAGMLVCDTLESAENAVRHVKERGLGRISVLARERCAEEESRPISLAGVIGWASDVVLTSADHEGWMRGLLSPVLLVRSAGIAEAILACGLARMTMVTPEGDVYSPKGEISTGARRAAGILSRKNELRRLAVEIADYDRIIEEREERRREKKLEIESTERRLEGLRQAIYEKNIELRDAQNRLEQIAARRQVLESENEAARLELEEIERQSRSLQERGEQVAVLLAELHALKAHLGGEIAGLGMTLARYREGREELDRRLTQAKVDLGKVEEKREAIAKRIEMIRANREEASARLEKIARLQEETAGRLEAVREEIDRRRGEREGLEEEIAGARSGCGEVETACRESRVAVEEARSAAEGLEVALAGIAGEIQDLRVREGALTARRDAHRTRAREEYALDMDELLVGYQDEEGIDWDLLSREVDELRIKLQSFGAVNVEALNELDGLEVRERELLAQQEDLSRTKEELEGLIRRLNRQSKEIFERTVEVVRGHFKEIFRKLFGGGKADIVLEEEEGVDAMDRGLEVMARPPAKELTSLSLLSGGERSLTALALTLALFRANPSPFCILDEADAALDEGNLEKYAGLVNEFVEDTQFIVITHNKRTMAVADVLYGVTMERPGVSKKVAVALDGEDGLNLLRGQKVAARTQRQAEARAQKETLATAVLEADEVQR